MTDTNTAIQVNVDNFVRAETSFQISRFLKLAGGLNKWSHNKTPTPLDKQNVIRMNRDTLYSFAVVDIRMGVTVTMPDPKGRYMTVMVVDEDHYVPQVLDFKKAGGVAKMSMEACGTTSHVVLIARTLADSNDSEDLKQANELQQQLELVAPSEVSYEAPKYDKTSYDSTYKLLLELSKGINDADRMFGSKEQVSQTRHLLGTAYGWGGLPSDEAFYLTMSIPLAVGDYELTVPANVPVDGFWSISVYNKDGFFEENKYDAYSLNNQQANANDDGSVTIQFGTEKGKKENFLYVMEGWNYTVRFYQPHLCILDRSWEFPAPKAV